MQFWFELYLIYFQKWNRYNEAPFTFEHISQPSSLFVNFYGTWSFDIKSISIVVNSFQRRQENTIISISLCVNNNSLLAFTIQWLLFFVKEISLLFPIYYYYYYKGNNVDDPESVIKYFPESVIATVIWDILYIINKRQWNHNQKKEN